MDMAKMVRKAQQTRSSMKKVQAAGKSKSGLTAVLLNGLNDIEEIEFADELFESCPDKKTITKEVKEAYADAKKVLEQQLAQNMSLDNLRDLLS